MDDVKALYRHTDMDNDQVVVFPAKITGFGYNLGRGVNMRTSLNGCSIPDEEIPGLIAELQRHLEEKEG